MIAPAAPDRSDAIVSTPTTVRRSQTLDARYQATFENAAVGIANVALDGRLLIANQRLADFLGYSKTELLELDLQSLTHPDDLPADEACTRRLLTGEIATFTLEKRYRRRDGTFVWGRLTASTVPGEDGRPMEFVGMVEDISARRSTEDELGRARRRIESALTASEVGTFEWDILHDRVYVDRNYLAIQPLTLEADGAVSVEKVLEHIHPDDQERIRALARNSLETGAPFEGDYRCLAGRTERWVTARGKMTQASDGRVVTFSGTITDVTQRKQAEAQREQLAQSFRRLSAIHETVLRTTSDFAYLFDREGRFLYANERLLTVWAKTLDQIVGKTCYDLGYPDWHAARHMREIAEVIATQQPICGEVAFTGASGISGVYEYIFSPVPGINGEVEYIAGTTRDVTARKRTEEALRESEQRLMLAQRAGGVGVYDWNVETGEVVWSPELERIYGGKAPDDPAERQRAWWRGIPAEDRERLERLTAEWLASGKEEAHWEYRFIRPDGEERWFSGHSIVVRREDNRPVRIVGTNIDITQRKQVESELRRARDEAEQANRAKDHFLAVLSHELRTPLSPVLAAAQILEEDGGLGAEQLDLVRTIRRNGELEARLIDDLLDLTRIARGKLVLNMREVRLHEKIRHVIGMCAEDLAQKHLHLTTRFSAARDHVRGDPARLQQVLWNLLKNAIKFTAIEGCIEIHTSEAAPGQLVVEIRDNGIGIEPEMLPHIFDAFEQGGELVTRQFGGLGLGLAISKALLDLHSGSLSAASAGKGKGASFTLRLPLSPRSRRTEPAPTFKDRPAVHASILLVEDHADTRRSMAALLVRAGCQVKAAASVAEGIAALAADRFDLLISDIGLPDASGVELMRHAKAAHGLGGVALSGYGMEEDVAKSTAAGFAAHLTKPVRFERLVEIVRELVAPKT